MKSFNIIEVIDTINKGVQKLKNFFENEIIEMLPKEAKEDFKGAFGQLNINCDKLNLLTVKIIKKGSDKYGQSTKSNKYKLGCGDKKTTIVKAL